MLTQQDASFTVIALLLDPPLCMRQDLGGKKGKSKSRHCYGTNSRTTKYTQVQRGAGRKASSRICSRNAELDCPWAASHSDPTYTSSYDYRIGITVSNKSCMEFGRIHNLHLNLFVSNILRSRAIFYG